jgi:hypothetical protein
METKMIGDSYINIVFAFQQEVAKALKKTNGDIYQLIQQGLLELQNKGTLSAEDRKKLELSFSEVLDALLGKKSSSKVRLSTRLRAASMIADSNSGDLARALAELIQSVMAEIPDATTTAAGTITGKPEQMLLWGVIGAVVGGSIGGPAGAVIGGAVGAAIGACPGDTQVSNGGGGSPT